MYDREGKIVDRREMLRVKVRSLAAESRIIRGEAHRTRGRLRWELNHHRQHVVRKHARNAHLALGFLRGRTIRQMEPCAKTEPNWDEVRRLCKKYGPAGWNGPSQEQVDRSQDQ